MYSKDRDEEVALIKKLITGEKVLCPKCAKAELEHFHKKAKKSNMYYVCSACGERYQVIKMLNEINQ